MAFWTTKDRSAVISFQRVLLMTVALSSLSLQQPRNAIFVVDAQTTLPPACSAQVTTPDQEGPFYISETSWTDSLAPEEQLTDTFRRLVVEGRVLGRNCLPVGKVLVEPWYAGLPDEDGNLYSQPDSPELLYRGRFHSDDCGNYQYIQTFPEVYVERDIRHVHMTFTTVHDAVSPAEKLTTQMYFDGFIPTKYNGYVASRDSQIVQVITDPTTGERRAVFDVYLDVDGDEALVGDGSDCGDGGSSAASSAATTTMATTPVATTASSSAVATSTAPPATSTATTVDTQLINGAPPTQETIVEPMTVEQREVGTSSSVLTASPAAVVLPPLLSFVFSAAAGVATVLMLFVD